MNSERLTEFWELVVSVWQRGVQGIDFTKILIAIGIFVAFLLLRRLFSRFVIYELKRLSKRTKTTLDDFAIETLDPPLRFVPVVMGFFFATEYLEADGLLDTIFTNTSGSLVAFTIFWGLYRLITPLSSVLNAAGGFFTEELIEWVIKALKAAAILLGAATILEIWGIAVAPLIAGLGLFGVAVALGAQDLFKNLIAGIFVIGEHRFEKGDWVLVDGVVEGTVERIGFRTTKIRRFDKAPVYVPNSALADNAVTNFSRMTHRRIKWLIGVEYRTTVAQLRQIRDAIERHLHESEEFASPDDVATFVRIDHFGDNSINILLYCFTKTTVWGEWLAIKESLAYTIKQIVEDAGSGFAFPSRSLYVESMPDAPEIFPLHQKSRTRDEKT